MLLALAVGLLGCRGDALSMQVEALEGSEPSGEDPFVVHDDPLPLGTTDVDPPPAEDYSFEKAVSVMSRWATNVIVARCGTAAPRQLEDGHIVSDVHLTEVDLLLGDEPPLDVTVPGGSIGETTEFHTGLPQLMAGRTYVLFYVTSDSGVPSLQHALEAQDDGTVEYGTGTGTITVNPDELVDIIRRVSPIWSGP